MNNVLLVQEFESQERLANDLNRLLFREDSTIEHRVEVFSLEVLLYDEKVMAVLENIKHTNDVWMPCMHQNIELVDKKIVKYGFLT